ncbi:MAG: murein biosynthesis integral membrane protein MurJ [Ktedonobacteraceae bacterium]
MRNDEQQPPQGPRGPQQNPGLPYNQGQPVSPPLARPLSGSLPPYPSFGPPSHHGEPIPPPSAHPLSGNLPPYPSFGPPSHYGQPVPPPSARPLSGNLPPYPNVPSNQAGYTPENNQELLSSVYYPDLTMDMGSSLGYGQSIQHHSISMPQPTESVPRLRQSRLQQLREERMRRQQRRVSPDATAIIGRKGVPRLPGSSLSGSLGNRSSPAPVAAPPYSPLPSGPSQQAPVQPPVLQAASAPAQDTGLIQRVQVARASSLISGALMISSVLGLLQTFLYTYIFGRSVAGDAYLQAYLIPNLIYTVIAGGALSSAFIPVFTSYEVGRKDERSAWHIASSALNISVVLMIVFSVIGYFLTPILVPIYSHGFKPAELDLIITLTRIMLIQSIVLGSGVIVGAMLNTKQDFTRTALGAVLYNIGLNLGLLPGFFMTFHAQTSTPADVAVYAATWGVVLGAILQVGIQLPGLSKINMRYTFVFDWKHPGVRQIGRQMVPRVINAMMLSFSTAVDRFLLAFLSTLVAAQVLSGLINEYFQAFSILLLPISIFGSSVSTAAFPTLAGYVARGRFDRVRSIIMETLRGILFLTIPSGVGLGVLAFPIAQTLLEHGNFDLQAAQYTSVALLCFAVGLPAFAAVEILVRSFYALQDSKTPVTISVAQFILKIALSIVLINLATFGVQWGMGALALSTSLACVLEAIVLFILLYQRIGGFDLQAMWHFLVRTALASGAMTVVLLVVRPILDHLLDTTSVPKLFVPGIFMALTKLLIELGCGSAAFLVVARLLKMEEMNSGLVRRVLNLLRIPWL